MAVSYVIHSVRQPGPGLKLWISERGAGLSGAPLATCVVYFSSSTIS